MKLDRELAVAHQLALEAAALVLRMRNQGFEVEHKAGDEPVTQVDRAANALIVEALAKQFPDDAILSEELPDDGSRFSKARVWMVDPIDGTRDFIHGENGYAVMIGLCIDGRPTVGVVSQPPTGVTWAGAVGLEAWRESGGDRVPLRPSTLAAPPGIRLVASKSHRTRDIDSFREQLAITDEMNVGGVGLKVGIVADGNRDLYVYPGGRTKIWDTCAPEAILVAAGGRITDTHGHALAYGESDLYNRRGIVASNGPLHDRVIEVLAALRATANM